MYFLRKKNQTKKTAVIIKGKERLLSLQGLRGIAFLLVFLSHVQILHSGNFGVAIFFILSGFVMYYTYHDKRMWNGGGKGRHLFFS